VLARGVRAYSAGSAIAPALYAVLRPMASRSPTIGSTGEQLDRRPGYQGPRAGASCAVAGARPPVGAEPSSAPGQAPPPAPGEAMRRLAGSQVASIGIDYKRYGVGVPFC